MKTSVARYVSGSRAASADGGAALTLAFTFATLVFVLILVFMLAFASGPRAHPLIVKTVIEIARTRIRTGGLTSVFFIFTLSAGFALSRDVSYLGGEEGRAIA